MMIILQKYIQKEIYILVDSLKVLAIILLTYFLIKYLFRIFAPFLIKRFISKMQKQFNSQYKYHPRKESKREGEVSIEKKNKSKIKNDKNLGEYVDFEEIE